MVVNRNKLGGAIICITAVIVLIVLMDFCLGGASSWLYHRSKYGIFHRQLYVLNESKDDIIILGSSRASHHYVSSIFTDSLGMSCYNAGSEGMCIYYHYAMLAAMIEKGNFPKIVLYDVMDLDSKKHPGPTFTLDAALDRLAPHYGEFACIDSLFELKDWKEKLKLRSMTYRYNSKLVQAIKCNFIPSPEDNGYESVTGNLQESVVFKNNSYDDCVLDNKKLEYVKRMIDVATKNHIKIFFILSPKYENMPSKAIEAIKEITEKKSVQWIDCLNEPSLMKRNLFRDMMHLNDEGAHVWSAFLAHLLKSDYFAK
jgi:hypothetical protein